MEAGAGETMKPAIGPVLETYRILLRLYPGEIRRRWEREMMETFALQLGDAWQEGGWGGVLQVWCCAVAELFQIALPLQVARAALLIPIVSLAGSSAIFFGLTWALENSLVLRGLYRHLITKLGG
jgi:hypothetical protein